ncbi:DUF226 domain-containing protein [Borrelia miyamotoi]|uniref:DUF226 domain-containing protein n=1 Tax=Borrelia miyamotoi TaxID=47466 RepID=A0AAQ2WXG0_9SPIR|nr:DUF226 domain-containing protein [Borrelia miyamotoi]QTL84014.1 DUF226 domain-containing protein [Borrelia miyamotoi]WAZ85653.1 DUF226 domain-containing protein [Borrelia miyamotoi]WAZ91436.1 DUF226 domain-containing protein [Borrelia miyamotoi]WAZ92723.1 DUF226 domain-containing protein [Borrelia miyamotoi]WAZ94014.1 DUF226 domain-containing protein [Borrelia miyamotoi]
MENVLKYAKEKKIEVISKQKKLLFIKIEEIANRKLYHTKIMMDLCMFGINKKQNSKFFIAFRGLFNQEKAEAFNLFALERDDKFLGIYYGYRKPIKNVVKKYEEDGITKAYTLSKAYYIEFRFKKGSIFCYIKGLARLVKKEKTNTKYCKTLITILSSLEEQVYGFYKKKLPDGGFIAKWIEKNQK